MTDDQVVQYVKQAQSAGKSQKQITNELLRRGVTKEQVLRIKKKYEEEDADSKKSAQKTTQMRKRRVNVGADGEMDQRTSYESAEIDDQMTIIDAENEDRELAEENEDMDMEQRIFGHDLFTNRNLSFEPNINLATPQNYRLGPGDEVIIDVWGSSEDNIRQVISPEGNIQVPALGPVHLNGMTIKQANSYLQREFSKIYSSIGGDKPTTQVRVTLGDIRTIQINIMGEVSVPGTYTLSAFSSVFHALYRAGGVNRIGSLRDIKVVRSGKTIANLDVYEILMQGKVNDDIRLQEGDVIIVSPYQELVQIGGKVKRPMYYEMKPTETVHTLLEYAGGFTGDAYKKAVRLIRKSGREHQVYNVDEMDFSVFRLDDGDLVTVDAILDRFENKIEVRGAVYRAGLYQLDGSVNTVKQLIKKAEGLRGDAFLNRAIIDREREDLTHEIIQVDIRGLMNGTVADIPLQKNDILYIPSIHDLQEEQTLTIHGEVANPGTFLYSDNMTVEDLVLQAGGLLESAATTRVEVARRMKSPNSTEFTTTVGETYVFDLRNGLLVGEGSDTFHLQPFDEVYVRKSPAYFKQQNVKVGGEVLFSGTYAMTKKNERLSDLIEKAGGVTENAYIKGARLMRRMSEEEIRRQQDAIRMAKNSTGGDSISLDQMDLRTTYSVGIDLQEALNKRGGDADLVLQEGDELFVPEYVSTVKISGAVMYPNTVSFEKGKSLKYYISQAGGFGNNAKKRKAYVIYMNGNVSRIRSNNSSKIEPGCEIVVPSKDPSKKMSTAEVISVGTSVASLATMIATLVTLFK